MHTHRKALRRRLGRLTVALTAAVTSVVAVLAVTSAAPAAAAPGSSLSHFGTVTNIASTVPPNGDVNPYGIVDVPRSTGDLVRGDTLVSNFNAVSNLQGTGTTIMEISPAGR